MRMCVCVCRHQRAQADEWFSRARRFMGLSAACQDIEQEIQMAEKALQRLTEVCGPFHRELYSARGLLMTLHMLRGE